MRASEIPHADRTRARQRIPWWFPVKTITLIATTNGFHVVARQHHRARRCANCKARRRSSSASQVLSWISFDFSLGHTEIAVLPHGVISSSDKPHRPLFGCGHTDDSGALRRLAFGQRAELEFAITQHGQRIALLFQLLQQSSCDSRSRTAAKSIAATFALERLGQVIISAGIQPLLHASGEPSPSAGSPATFETIHLLDFRQQLHAVHARHHPVESAGSRRS